MIFKVRQVFPGSRFPSTHLDTHPTPPRRQCRIHHQNHMHQLHQKVRGPAASETRLGPECRGSPASRPPFRLSWPRPVLSQRLYECATLPLHGDPSPAYRGPELASISWLRSQPVLVQVGLPQQVLAISHRAITVGTQRPLLLFPAG